MRTTKVAESEIRAMHAFFSPEREKSLVEVIQKIVSAADKTSCVKVYPICVGYVDESRRIDIYCGLKYVNDLKDHLLQEVGIEFTPW